MDADGKELLFVARKVQIKTLVSGGVSSANTFLQNGSQLCSKIFYGLENIATATRATALPTANQCSVNS